MQPARPVQILSGNGALCGVFDEALYDALSEELYGALHKALHRRPTTPRATAESI